MADERTAIRSLAGQTGHLIRRAQQRHTALWGEVVSDAVTGPQYAVLAVLHERPGASQRELGEALELDASTIAGLVARLEARGQITRDPHEGDGRKKVLHLTDAGAAVRAELAPRVDRLQVALTANLTADERAQLTSMLQRILTD